MDIFGTIISNVTDRLRQTGYFDIVYGLCEKGAKENDYIFYVGSGQSQHITNFDNQSGSAFILQRFAINIQESTVRRPVACEKLYNIIVPLRVVSVIKKSELPCDNDTSGLQAAQASLNALSGIDQRLKLELQAIRTELIPVGVDDELKGLNVGNEYAVGVTDFNLIVTTNISCLPALCETIYVPPADCPNGIAQVNGTNFGTIVSGATINVPVEYVNGTPVGSKVGSVWQIPDIPPCDDATAVVKNTSGTTLSTTNIPSGDSQDIVAPNGDITVNSTPFDDVLSGGVKNIPVKYVNGTDVGSKVGTNWEIPDPVKTLVTRVQFDTGATLSYSITIGADTAGTYTAAAFSGGMASATYTKNAGSVTIPFSVVATDVLVITPNAVGVIKLTGTYP